MARNRIPRLNGLHPLAYLGDNPTTPPNIITQPRAPTVNDYREFLIGDMWIDITNDPPAADDVWILVDKDANVATWVQLSGGAGDVASLSGDAGINPVLPDGVGNINVFGDNSVGLTVSGDGVNTLTVTTTNSIAILQTLSGDAGGVVLPDGAGNIDVLGGTAGRNINTAGNLIANTLNVEMNNTITLGDLSIVLAGSDALTVTSGDITLSGTGVGAAGNINIPDTTTDARQGIITFGSNRFISNFGTGNTFAGEDSGNTTLSGTNNSGFGNNALLNLTTGSANTVVGVNSGLSITIGNNNNAFGVNSLDACTTGNDNTAFGNATLTELTIGSSNVAIGRFSCDDITSGSQNVGIGNNTLDQLITGSDNLALGTSSGAAYTGAESSNILLLNAGTLGESNTIRLGSSGGGAGQQNRCFIVGIRGVTTGVADAVAVLVDSADQLGTVSSSRRYKENIADLGDQSEIIYELEPKSFVFTKHPEVPAWGLIAEDVDKVFPQLVVYKDEQPETVKYHDLTVLLLNELKKLKNRVDELESRFS